ncbi:MAG TPA: ATP-binding protein [Gammaproteobacteria bacterium]|nr:ATP-binding protein [Gammaproteobacteria bacterium]
MSQRVDNAVFGGDAGASGALRLLFWLRWGAVAAQSVVITFVDRILASPVPLKPLVLTIAALALWNVLNYRAVHAKRLVQYGEVALNLVVDVVAFTTILYFTGGPTNPFVSIYLVPISLAAASLPAVYAWLIGAICGVGYSLLWWRHVPLPSVDSRFGADFDLHVAGMWVNFLIAAALIVFFVGRMANLVRRRDQELAAMRETALRDQQIVELGTLAAGTAHELNTPLSTLAILVEELDETATDPAQREHLRVMMEEIETINERLNRIAGRVGAERSEGAQQIGLRAFLDDLIGHWTAVHPDIELGATFDLPADDTPIVAEATIGQAIRNVLDNAAHASRANGRRSVDVRVRRDGSKLEIDIVDDGVGLDPALRDEIGLKVVSTKDRGLGIGILLSRAALQRFGGRLELESRPLGGVEAHIHLPLDELLADAR